MKAVLAAFSLLLLSLLPSFPSVARQTSERIANTGPSWSPDGAWIGFSSNRSGNFELYAIHPDGTGLRRLTTADGDDHYPTWSPDGSKIAFISDRDGENKLWVMKADGTDARPLATTKTAWAPSWAPDGQRITFMVMVKNALNGEMRMPKPGELDTEVFVVDAGGGEPVNVSNHEALDSAPVWSPDGSRIAFSSNRHDVDNMRGRDIYTIKPDGSGLERITEIGGVTTLGWSPDGSRILFGSRKDGNPEVYVMKADGTDVRNLTDDPGSDFYGAWSPDGAKIVFASSRGGDQDIYVMNADGTGVAQVTHH